MRTRARALFAGIALTIVCGSPGALDAQKPRGAPGIGARVPCEVTTVHDGDTFRCQGDVRVRLLLVDAPELDQRFGADARQALRDLLPRTSIAWLEYDVQRRDRYGRTLAYAWTAESGGRLLNLELARSGWVTAVVYPPNVRRIEEIRAAVQDARRSRRGIWASGVLCEPVDHKKGRC